MTRRVVLACRVFPTCRVVLACLAFAVSSGWAQAAERDFDPLRYFAGRTRSAGVVLDSDGTLKNRITGTTRGRREPDGATSFDQTIRYDDGKVTQRRWRVVRTGSTTLDATATDLVGTATGEVRGPELHLRSVLRTDPGNPLLDVDFEQWLTVQPDGRTVLNRSEVRKFGILVRRVEERFVRTGRS